MAVTRHFQASRASLPMECLLENSIIALILLRLRRYTSHVFTYLLTYLSGIFASSRDWLQRVVGPFSFVGCDAILLIFLPLTAIQFTYTTIIAREHVYRVDAQPSNGLIKHDYKRTV